ncbi:hypothetical protein V6N13_026657 [Hibiscus sabdariffa]|uniref:Uncharacterized protein n=1 Tax=Hibiscus sabdariffa TaxID=183260 RepID=A0ABR2BTK1_9ROSI
MTGFEVLSSSSQSDSQSLPVQPVSYAPKPKEPQQHQHPDQAPQSTPAAPEGCCREDLRYVKDISNISPVSYPGRVAPLPEDRLRVSEQDGEVRDEGSEEMAREGQRIQAESRVWRRPFRIAAEEEKTVFPSLC